VDCWQFIVNFSNFLRYYIITSNQTWWRMKIQTEKHLVMGRCLETLKLEVGIGCWIQRVMFVIISQQPWPLWISQSNFVSWAKPEMWNTMRNTFPAKRINDNMFIEDLVTWCHYNVTLENCDIMLISRLLLGNWYYHVTLEDCDIMLISRLLLGNWYYHVTLENCDIILISHLLLGNWYYRITLENCDIMLISHMLLGNWYYHVTLENCDIMLISHLLFDNIACQDQREMYKSSINCI
jgi:(2Fe-2S) ferredoxin